MAKMAMRRTTPEMYLDYRFGTADGFTGWWLSEGGCCGAALRAPPLLQPPTQPWLFFLFHTRTHTPTQTIPSPFLMPSHNPQQYVLWGGVNCESKPGGRG